MKNALVLSDGGAVGSVKRLLVRGSVLSSVLQCEATRMVVALK